jgi:hypothetical protein
MTLSASGSPEATPSVNGSPGSSGVGGAVVVGAVVVGVVVDGVLVDGVLGEVLPTVVPAPSRQAATTAVMPARRKARRLIGVRAAPLTASMLADRRFVIFSRDLVAADATISRENLARGVPH